MLGQKKSKTEKNGEKPILGSKAGPAAERRPLPNAQAFAPLYAGKGSKNERENKNHGSGSAKRCPWN